MIVWPGLRRSVSAISRLFNSAAFDAPLTHSAIPTRAAPGTTATFTRATTATVRDHEGVLRTAIAGEARFEGARRVYNQWSVASEPTSSTGYHTATNVTFDSGISGFAGSAYFADASVSRTLRPLANSAALNRTWLVSFYVQRDDGGVPDLNGYDDLTLTLDGSDILSGVTVTLVSGTLYRAVKKWTPTSSQEVIVRKYTGGFNNNNPIRATGFQLEDITGRADQTTPSEYVSVGVLSAPYHGAGVDGVKCFPTDLNGNALPTRYTYDAVSLNGVAGTYVSTPDSVAASITGDIDIRVKAALNDWTPTVENYLAAKLGGPGERSYDFYIAATTGKPTFRVSTTGVNAVQYDATVAPVVADGSPLWIRATREAATGTAYFYTSSDGVAWTQLGDPVVVTAGNIFDSPTEPLTFGGRSSGSNLSGKIYQAQIYNGIDGTLAVDFDASRYAGGSTLTGSTGETWTLQGNAVIHPTNNPMLGYLAEGARTNLCLQSQDFATTWSINAFSVTISSNAAVAPDGTTTADKIVETATNTDHGIFQLITFTAAAYTVSVYAKKGERDWLRFNHNATGAYKNAYFNLATGVVGTVDSGWTATISDAGNGWYRCSASFTGTAAAINVAIYNTTSDGGTSHLGDITKGTYLWGAQVELGSFASSYIPTTTIAVARNADVLTYSSAGNTVVGSGWLYFESYSSVGESEPRVVISDGIITSNSIFVDDGQNANGGSRLNTYSASGLQGVSIIAGATSANTLQKRAGTWNTNFALVAQNGTLGSVDTSVVVPVSFTTIGVGGTLGVPLGISTFRNLRIGQRQLSASEMQAITA